MIWRVDQEDINRTGFFLVIISTNFDGVYSCAHGPVKGEADPRYDC
jgi:hypothetical protein